MLIVLIVNFAAKRLGRPAQEQPIRRHTLVENIITTKDLKRYYGNFEPSRGSRWIWPEREITALIGPSGAASPPSSRPSTG